MPFSRGTKLAPAVYRTKRLFPRKRRIVMHIRRAQLTAGLLAATLGAGACTPAGVLIDRVSPAPEPPPPAAPAEAPPGPDGDVEAWEAALASDGTRIVVSRQDRWLWLMEGERVVKSAPVAIGRDTIWEYGGRKYDFSTPTGKRTVLGKEESPQWVPPDWHYFEQAEEKDLTPVHLKDGQQVALSDGTRIEVRKGEVGRVNQFGNFWPFTPGSSIIFDGKIFIPPIGSPQRRIPKVLGTHRLILGDGYLIHGTPEEDSIGTEASHGCIRMFNRDVAALYQLVPKGTAVFIY